LDHYLLVAIIVFLVAALTKVVSKARRQERFYETILAQLPVAVFCKNIRNEYRFNLWNRKAETLWGLTPDQVIGKNDYDLFPKEQADWFRKKDEDTAIHGDMLVIPEEAVTSSVSQVTVRTRKVIVRDNENNPLFLVGISEDITEQKKNQELIEAQRLQMIHTTKMTALGEMSGGIAHEINNPLAIIEIYASQLAMLAEDDKLDIARVLKAASTISATVERIARITRGLRAFARDGENDPFVATSVEILLLETVDFCREKFSNHGIKVELKEVSPNLRIECRGTQISQILLNLMNNSFDAVADIANAFVRVEVLERENDVVISVTDSGPGITPEIAEKMMQPFFTTKAVGKGIGLGLSISEGILRSHSGELLLDSSSENTRFCMRLPKTQKAEKDANARI
jgi:PAS domain S-box-containing protein